MGGWRHPNEKRTMHAHVVTVDFTDVEAAIKGLEELVPNVKASPGFVAGYWIRLDDSHGTSIAVFDTEDQARAVARRSAAKWTASGSRARRSAR